MTYKLIPGEEYTLGTSLLNPKIYVSRQFLPSTNKEWETFVSLLGADEHWMIVRNRVSSESITRIENKKIISLEEPVDKIVWPKDKNRKPLVGDWLSQVERILIRQGYNNTDSFREYFK